MAKAMDTILVEARLNSQMPYLKQKKVFESMKRKLDLPSRDDMDSHHYDHMNFMIPNLGQIMTRSQCSKQFKAASKPWTSMVTTMAFMQLEKSSHTSLCNNQMAW